MLSSRPLWWLPVCWAVCRCQAGWALRVLAGLQLCPQEAQRIRGLRQLWASDRHLGGQVALSSEWMDGGQSHLAGTGLERPRLGEQENSGPLTQTPSSCKKAQLPALGPRSLLGPGAGQGWWCAEVGWLQLAGPVGADREKCTQLS